MPLQENVDFYFNDAGLMVLTAHFLAARGFCCGKGCLHCPYEPRHGGRSAKLAPSKDFPETENIPDNPTKKDASYSDRD